MMTSGMYDFAGEWTYRVGIPAKSGVGGGITAVLPAQLGVGTFSPRLDSRGNSVRGIKACEALSSRFDLHMLNRGGDVRSCLIADYEAARVSSRRNRPAHERKILDERRSDIRVARTRRRADFRRGRLRRAPPRRTAAARLVADFRSAPRAQHHQAGRRSAGGLISPALATDGVTVVVAGLGGGRAAVAGAARPPDRRGCGVSTCSTRRSSGRKTNSCSATAATTPRLRELSAQPLLAGLSPAEIAALKELTTIRRYESGEKIIVAGAAAESLFFLESGMVSVKLPSGVRLATFGPGDGFGEMAMIESRRSADVFADVAVVCLELPLAALGRSAPARSSSCCATCRRCWRGA